MMKNALLAAAALAVSGVACAQQSPSFYVAATGGVASADIDCEGLPCDKRDTGWKLLAGVKVHPNVAIEVQAHSFGEFSARIPGFLVGTAFDPELKIKTSGFGAGVALSAPLGANAEGFLRLGVASNKAKSSLESVGSIDDTATKPYAGVGIAYRVTPSVALRAEVESTQFKPADDNLRVTMFSAGLTFSF